MLASSSKDTIYPSKKKILETTQKQILKWTKHHNMLALENSWKNFVRKEWPLHLQECQTRNLHTFKQVQHIRAILKDFIIQCEDHAPTKLCVFCPKQYLQLHIKTMNDPKVFKVHKTMPTQVHADLPSKFPAELRKRYKWGIQQEKPLPSCYIFPKRKKNFTTARPVITFYKTQFSQLYRALGKLISDITRVVYHNAFHGKTTIQTFNNLHAFLRNNTHNLQNFTWRNDDIKGFFTSIEHDVIISAFYHMLQKYCDQNTHTQASAIKFMIDYDQPAKQPRTIQGRSIKQKPRDNMAIRHYPIGRTVPPNKCFRLLRQSAQSNQRIMYWQSCKPSNIRSPYRLQGIRLAGTIRI